MQCPGCETELTRGEIKSNVNCPYCGLDFTDTFDQDEFADDLTDELPLEEMDSSAREGPESDINPERDTETSAAPDDEARSGSDGTSEDAGAAPDSGPKNGSSESGVPPEIESGKTRAADPRIKMLLKAHENGLKVITFIGFSNSGKTWLIRRVLHLLNQRDWEIDADPDVFQRRDEEDGSARPRAYSGFLVDGERVQHTPVNQWFIHAVTSVGKAKRDQGFLLADIAGESFARFLEPGRFFDEASEGVQEHLLALLAISAGFVFVVPSLHLATEFDPRIAREEIEAGGGQSIETETHYQLRNSLSTFGNVANAVDACHRHKEENGTESLFHEFDLRDALQDMKFSADTASVDRTMFIALSKADDLRQLATGDLKDSFDCDPVYFAAKAMPELLSRCLNRFRCVKVDFVTAFDRRHQLDESIRSDEIYYSWPHYGVDEMVYWIANLLEAGPEKRRAWSREFEDIAAWRAFYGRGAFGQAWKRIRPKSRFQIFGKSSKRSLRSRVKPG